jgi:hypothetical protein
MGGIMVGRSIGFGEPKIMAALLGYNPYIGVPLWSCEQVRTERSAESLLDGEGLAKRKGRTPQHSDDRQLPTLSHYTFLDFLWGN